MSYFDNLPSEIILRIAHTGEIFYQLATAMPSIGRRSLHQQDDLKARYLTRVTCKVYGEDTFPPCQARSWSYSIKY